MSVYLDWNATTSRHPDVIAAMNEAEESAWANPSSVHQAGRKARRHVEDTREMLARVLQLSPRDIVFTGSGTEANHLALFGARLLVTTRLEHPSIVAEAENMAQTGCRVVFAPVDGQGVVSPRAIFEALDEGLGKSPSFQPRSGDGGATNANTPLVAVSAVNHETGMIQPIAEIARVVHARAARLHVDAVQLLGRGDLRVLNECDSLAVASHKIRGPKGVGALAFQCGWVPFPRGRGGAQERGLRPGTIDAIAVSGFFAALSRLGESERGYQRAGALGSELREVLKTRGLVAVSFHGSEASRLEHVVNFRVSGWKGDELVAALDLEGICVSSGSACSAGSAEASPVITAMLGREAALGAVRVSFGEGSTREDLDALLAALKKLGIISLDD